MPRKSQFLELHRGQYRVVVSVPRDLHPLLGTKLKRPLGTDSLTTAEALKWPIVAEFKKKIADLRSGSPADPIRAEAALFREAYANAETDEEVEALDYGLSARIDELAGEPTGVAVYGNVEHTVFDPDRARLARQFSDMAQGRATTIDSFWPAAGFVDTEFGCFMKPEVAYAAKTVWA